MTVWTFLRLEFAKPAGFGPWRSALLQAIAKYGSIAAAADAMDQDYRAARDVVRSINRQFGEIIVVARGRNGGAHLTPKGKKLLKRYLEIERKFYEVFAEDLRELEELSGGDPDLPARIQRYALVREPQRRKLRPGPELLHAPKADANAEPAALAARSKRQISSRGRAGR